jgi:autotransporter passenger strand-loop-strand repeat protein
VLKLEDAPVTTVGSGDIEIVQSGQTSTDTLVESGGTQEVLGGGTAIDADIYGTQTVLQGGYVSNTFVESGGVQIMLGAEFNEFIKPGGSAIVYKGGVLSSFELSAGGIVTISSGGKAIGDAWGNVYVEVGGSSFARVYASEFDYGLAGGEVWLGGQLYIEAGGKTLGEAVDSGGTETIFASATTTNSQVSGEQIVNSGGLAVGPGILAGGLQVVDSGGESLGGLIAGEQDVYGSAVSGYVRGGSRVVFSGGESDFAAVENGGAMTVHAHGLSQAATLLSGSLAVQSAASGSGTFIGFQSIETILFGGQTTGDAVGGGGSHFDFGVTQSLTISSGGSAFIYGESDSAAVLAGGIETVVDGGGDFDSVVAGTQVISSGSVAAFVTVSGAGAMQVVSGNGSARYFQIDSGAVQTVVAGGLAFSGSIDAGGAEVVSSGGLASATDVETGGVMSLLSGASESAAYVQGVLSAQTGATLHGATIAAGGVLELFSGAVLSSVTLQSGATLLLAHDLVGAGQTLEVGPVFGDTNVSGALLTSGAADTTISSVVGGANAIEDVLSGGVTSHSFVLAGGEEFVSAGGTALAITVSSGGDLFVQGLGRARQASLAAGALLVDSGAVVESGGSFALNGILSGRGAVVEAGGGVLAMGGVETRYAGQATISAGTIELAAAGALAKASVQFAAGILHETLRIDAADRPPAGGAFAAPLADFDRLNTAIDLAGLAFVAGAKATLSGHTLTLTDGAYSASFTLGGGAASKYAVVSDGAGGTLIRAAAGSTVTPLLVHAMAAFATLRRPGIAPTSPASAGPPTWLATPKPLETPR